jgi:acyl-CoA thioesterase FadM
MNLYLRLIWLLLRLPLMKKVTDPLAITKLYMRALPNDLDLNMHVNNGRYLTLLDLGRIHLTAVTGLLRPLLKHGYAPMLGSAKVNFIRPLRAFDKFTMTTQLIYWDEKWLYLEQKIYKGEQLCVVALFKALFMSKQGKITPEAIFPLAGATQPNRPMMSPTLEAWIQAEKVSKDQANV